MNDLLKRDLHRILLLSVFLCGSPGVAQVKKPRPVPAKPAVNLKKQITVLAGAGIPLSKEGLTQFWKLGPSGSLSFLVNVTPPTSVGIGADFSMLYFKMADFGSTFPTVPVQRKDIAMIHIYVGFKQSFSPARVFSPYIAGTVGAARVTGASYKEIIDSVRVTYYDIPGRTRLAASFALGTDIVLSRVIAFTMEAKATYFHNDPDVGVMSFVRGGFRFSF